MPGAKVVVISGTSSGVGKTSVTIGMMTAFRFNTGNSAYTLNVAVHAGSWQATGHEVPCVLMCNMLLYAGGAVSRCRLSKLAQVRYCVKTQATVCVIGF